MIGDIDFFLVEIYENRNSRSGWTGVRVFTHLSLECCVDWKLKYLSPNKDIAKKKVWYLQFLICLMLSSCLALNVTDTDDCICGCMRGKRTWYRTIPENPTTKYFTFTLLIWSFCTECVYIVVNLLLHIALSVLTFFVPLFVWVNFLHSA